MPHINRVRLVNVKYNDAKSCYDNFIMNFEGKSATYDLQNGGGKSVMLLMMLQNVLPNTYLKSDRPLKNIFKGGNQNRTSHCLIEWILDEDADYKYLLTGFCARKKQEDGEEDDNSTLGVEYFNYCYLYNTQNANDLKQIPLIEETRENKTVMSYEKLKQHLSNMRRENLPVQTFTSKKEYQKYIEYFGLISAEWKLINEINTGENNIESYFKANKTSRKLIENFLIKIIDNINLQNSSELAENEDLAEALINIKENLIKFKKESDNKKEYEQTKELFRKLKTYAEEIENNQEEKTKIHQKAYETYVFNKTKKEELEKQIEKERTQIEEYENSYAELENRNSQLEIDKEYIEQEKIIKSFNEIKSQKEGLEQEYQKKDKQIKEARAQNEYLEYKEKKDLLRQKQIQIEKMNCQESEIEKEYQLYGANYLGKIREKKKKIEEQLAVLNIKQEEVRGQETELTKQVKNANNSYISIHVKVENLEKELKDDKDDEDNLVKELSHKGYIEGLLNLEETIEELSYQIENLKKEKQENDSKRQMLKDEINENKIKLVEEESKIEKLQKDQEEISQKYKIYEQQRRKMETLLKTFNVQDLKSLQINLELKKESIRKAKVEKEIERQIKQKKLELIEKYQIAVPNEDIFLLKEKLEKKCSYVTTGIEELTKMEEGKRKQILEKNPWYIYSIFIDKQSFEHFQKQGIDYEVGNLVPVANVEFLREEGEKQEQNLIYPMAKEIYQTIDSSKLQVYQKELESKIEKLALKMAEIEREEQEVQALIGECEAFQEEYSEKNIKKLEEEKQKLAKEIEEKKDFKKQLLKDNEKKKLTIETLEDRNSKIPEECVKVEEDRKWFEDLKETKSKIKTKTLALKDLQKEQEIAKEIYDTKSQELTSLQELQKRNEQQKLEKENYLEAIRNTEKNLDKFETIKDYPLLEAEFDEIKNHYEALDKKVTSQNSQLNEIQEVCQMLKEAMDKCQKTIEDNGFTISELEQKKEMLSKTLDSVLKELKNDCSKLEEEIKQYEEKERSINEKTITITSKIQLLVEQLEKRGVTYLKEEKSENIESINYEMAENKQKMILTENKKKALWDKIADISKEIKELELQTEKFEFFMDQYQVKKIPVDVQNLLESELYSYSKIVGRTKELKGQMDQLEKGWNKFLRLMKEQVKEFYIASDIEEVIENIQFPEEVENAHRVKNGIEENLSLIDEKLVHIEETLKSLAEYQEQFNSKCFEKAEVVVRDLNKLSGLSRIKIAGKETNIVKLELHEYEKDEKQARIKSYIESIVKEMEINPEWMDKVKLNERLSSKALVAQVVNMDKASVKLYKIEDIAEHSGYKRWEDDLGSDGQVNALYFMFAVCIISYISMLTRPQALANSKKVMIADNPFGATSAVYLWEGMFAMLKENNVQLIAPGHNISKELISKFEVNYILRSDYKGDNTKYVVVDRELRTEHEEKSMNFDVLKGVQESFL